MLDIIMRLRFVYPSLSDPHGQFARALKDGVDLIGIVDRLFGMRVVATNSAAVARLLVTNEWRESALSPTTSLFLVPDLTKDQIAELFRKLFRGITIEDENNGSHA
ncbi:MAG: hypothetical protein HY978_04525 [Candidatus Liptonbacteria bacterium]|nr:hypothetical protein [Candidatus Liptonbacteria bacterium]